MKIRNIIITHQCKKTGCLLEETCTDWYDVGDWLKIQELAGVKVTICSWRYFDRYINLYDRF